MTRGEAINWIINLTADIGKVEHQDLWHYEQALDEIRDMIEELPSAQPTQTNTPNALKSLDCIDRQAAIDALNKLDVSDGVGISSIACDLQEEAIRSIKSLPSAQPEIIRCNSCKHWTQTIGAMRGFGLGICDFHNAKYVTCNGFCHWAERREDTDHGTDRH